MRVHPLKQEGDHWACRSCDCEAERAVSYFSLKVPLGFPIAANFACYDLEVRENVAIGCKGAVLVNRAFKATEVLADAPKLTAKQKEDLVKCAGQHRLLLPGTRHEYEFFQKFDKLTGGSHFATRRAALRYMTYAHLQMALALFALGFSSARLLHSYAAYARRRHAKESRLVRLPAVWGEFESVEALNLKLEKWLKKPIAFFNAALRPEALRELGPIDMTAFLNGSAARHVKRPIVVLEPDFYVGRLEDAFEGDAPAGEHRCGASGVVGPCREAGGDYVSYALAVCASTLAKLAREGRARLTDDVAPVARDDGVAHVFPSAGTVRGEDSASYVLYHANTFHVSKFHNFLLEVQKKPLSSLTLTAPFDFDPDVTTKAWATMKTAFPEDRGPPPAKGSASADGGDEACFALVATCAEARATRDDGEWGFCPKHLTLLRRSGDGYETAVSRERWTRRGEVYPCNVDNDMVLVPAACATSLPRHCLPIASVRLPADPRAARVVETAARRVSSTSFELM